MTMARRCGRASGSSAPWIDGRPSRSRPCGGQHQCVAFDDQPTLGSCVSASYFEIRHLPIADFGCLGKIVQVHLIADTASLGIYDDTKQPPANLFGGLPARTIPTDPATRNILRDDMFFHAAMLRTTVVRNSPSLLGLITSGPQAGMA